MGPSETTLLISSARIEKRVRELAKQISEDFKGQSPVFVAVLKGAVFFLSDLVRELTIPARIDFLRAASYGSATVSSRDVRLTYDVELPLRGEAVILVEDIVDTGHTLARLLDHLKAHGPRSLSVCTLIDKIQRREVEVTIDYCGFSLQEGFLVGYGLDFDERYRNLPELHVLHEQETEGGSLP